MISRHQFVTAVIGTASLLVIQGLSSFMPPSSPLFRTATPLLGAAPVMAKAPKYIPPGGGGAPNRTLGAGSRGCPQDQQADQKQVSFRLLIPSDHTAQTAAAHPTFTWYVSAETSGPVQFALVEPGVSQPIFIKQFTTQKAGINQLTVPEDAPALLPGRKYRWTVSQICNVMRPSQNAYASGWVEHVAPTAVQSQAITAATSAPEKAKAYGESGFWYDALAALAQAYMATPQNQTVKADLMGFLEQGGVTQIQLQDEVATHTP